MYRLEEIKTITSAKLIGNAALAIHQVLFDSRQLQTVEGTLFFALRSGRNDGHRYIEELYRKGLRNFVVEEGYQWPQTCIGSNVLVCKSPLQALQELAAFHRKKFNIPVIGITGSNGKTIVKEWLYQCLKQEYSICRSPRSYNSQIGVPVSVLNLAEHHSLAIFEAGVSQTGEMQSLADIIQPTLGVFTHLGSAHDEGFTDRTEKLKEKYKLFAGAITIVSQQKMSDEQDLYPQKNKLFAEDFEALTANVPMRDASALQNAATCAAVMFALGYNNALIKERLSKLQPVAMRLEMRSAINNSLLINDFYNSDLDSLRIALQYMRQNSRRQRNCVILSDIEQSGLSAAQLYKAVQSLLAEVKIDVLVGIGSEISKHKFLFPSGSLFFPDAGSFVAAFRGISYQFSHSTILLKGARAAGFEQLSRVLQLKSHDTVCEINLDRLRDNVNYFRGLLKPNTMMMCMVKATAYGSGSAEIARLLQNIRVNYLAVAYADEGVELRESLITLPIMVMSPEEEAFDDIINYQLEPEIYSMSLLEKFAKRLDDLGITSGFNIHIKIDTGMKRLGFDSKELEALAMRLTQLPQLHVVSVFSHLAGADNADLDDFTRVQISRFEAGYATLVKGLGYAPVRHICNSAGISRFPEAQFEMVRLGIGMYGVGVNEKEQNQLQNVNTLKSKISQVRAVDANETVGYNRNGRFSQASKIAVVPIGYADGFSRQLGGGKHGVYINNKFCATVGNICMDMCMVDVTNVTCKAGDEVIIFSDNKQLQRMADALSTITYEVLTSVSARVKRIYTQE